MTRSEAFLLPPYFLISLFPLGIYLLVLANVNRRHRPLLLSGVADALFLSFGLSGIFLWFGPAILGAFYERGLLAAPSEGNRRFEQIWSLYPWLWGGYYVLVVAGQALMILSRRDKTVVYNVDFPALQHLVADALAQQGCRVSNRGAVIVFESADRPGTTGAVDVEAFAPLRNATLHWHTHDLALRRAVEHAISARLDDAATETNPSVAWLLSISGILFGLVIIGAVMMIAVKLLIGRH